MSEEKKDESQGAPSTLTEERVIEIMNTALGSALAGHSKRQASALDKLLDEKLSRVLEANKPQAPAQDEAGKAESTKTKLLEQQLAELQRQFSVVDQERKTESEARRSEAARNQLRNQLSGKVRPELLDVAVGHLVAATKSLRFDEEGNAILAVKRSRAKGAPADEQIFALDDGVSDWLKTEEAKAFIPAPVVAQKKGPEYRPGITPKTYEKPPVTDEERARRALEMMGDLGVGIE